jgi:hypothetical protein
MPFLPGNQYGRGRPKISLNKPELLLPIIFQKAHINWANDFTNLYKTMKMRKLTQDEESRWKTYLDLMPYLCTKVVIKDLDASKFVTEKDKKAMTDQTAALIEALENGANAKPQSASGSKETGLGDGKA